MNIGLTGKFASGKSEAAKIIKSLGFEYLSLSDFIREELINEGKEISRDNMILKGNELRKQHGPGYIAKMIRTKIKSENYIIDSIRSPFEVEELRKLKDFHLMAIDAPIEMRFTRLKKRKRAGDVKTLDELKEAEKRENLENDSNQQLDKTFLMADAIIINDKTRKYLKTNILNQLIKWGYIKK